MHTMNLLPQKQYVYYLRKTFLRKIGVWIIGSLLLLGVLTYGFCHGWLYKINSETDALQKTQTNQAPEFNEVKILLKKTQEYETQFEIIKQERDEVERLYEFLSSIPHTMPKQLFLVSLSWYQHTGILYGQAADHHAVSEFLAALKQNTYFNHIVLLNSDYRHEDDGELPIYFMIEFS